MQFTSRVPLEHSRVHPTFYLYAPKSGWYLSPFSPFPSFINFPPFEQAIRFSSPESRKPSPSLPQSTNLGKTTRFTPAGRKVNDREIRRSITAIRVTVRGLITVSRISLNGGWWMGRLNSRSRISQGDENRCARWTTMENLRNFGDVFCLWEISLYKFGWIAFWWTVQRFSLDLLPSVCPVFAYINILREVWQTVLKWIMILFYIWNFAGTWVGLVINTGCVESLIQSFRMFKCENLIRFICYE